MAMSQFCFVLSHYKDGAALSEVVTKKIVGYKLDSLSQSWSCEDECPIKMTAEIIEGKWTTLVVRELLSGKKRYSEIQKALVGISPKLLSARLRLLEDRGVITRTVFPTIPPTTEYELTEIGRKLERVLIEMAGFGNELKKRGQSNT